MAERIFEIELWDNIGFRVNALAHEYRCKNLSRWKSRTRMQPAWCGNPETVGKQIGMTLDFDDTLILRFKNIKSETIKNPDNFGKKQFYKGVLTAIREKETYSLDS